MAGRRGTDGKRLTHTAKARRCGLVMGGAVSAFVAAAAMATGSAAPAKADFESLIDPIIQPLLTSLTDSLSAVDPAAALDITSWTDSLLSSLGSVDLALPSVAEPAAAAASSAVDSAASTGGTIPLSVVEGTEPAVNASIAGGSSVPLLVDTGSGGLVVPESDLGVSNLWQLFLQDGMPSSFGSSGYSGGVDYIYLTYNSLPVAYDGGLTTTGPVDVEVYSWDPSNFGSLFTNDAFQNFLTGNGVSGILGIGENTAGPTTSPFESFGNVTVDVPGKELIVGGTPVTGTTLSGAPISTDYISIDGGALQAVSNDVDSGGVTGTIPSSLLTSSEYNSTTDLVNPGTTIAVYADKAGTEELYSYTVTAANDPYVVSGSTMDSGVEPFLLGPISMTYTPAGTGTTIFGG
ncbi:MAG: PecA family PE domain-processing aspartic protease [Mycobacterium sp.]